MTMNKKTAQNDAGFTLLELMFVIALFALMSTIVLFRFKNFGTATAFENLAQDVALRVVQAQKTAISGTFNASFASAVKPTYGVYFESGSATGTTNHQFIYFTDGNGDRKYNSPSTCVAAPAVGTDACISVTAITTGEYVSSILYNTPAAPTVYTPPAGAVHITFQRPFPDATIIVCPTAACSTTIAAQDVYIEFTSSITPALKKTIIVTSLGSVRVYNGPASSAHP